MAEFEDRAGPRGTNRTYRKGPNDWWTNAIAECEGHLGGGGAIAFGPLPYALLSASDYGDRVWFRGLVWVTDYYGRGGHWHYEPQQWRDYIPLPDGNRQDGTIFDDGAGMAPGERYWVGIGWTTAPGVWQNPDSVYVPSGYIAYPYIQAYSLDTGYGFAMVAIDKWSVGVQGVNPNGCYFP